MQLAHINPFAIIMDQQYLDGFVIGFRAIEEFDDILKRIERVQITR